MFKDFDNAVPGRYDEESRMRKKVTDLYLENFIFVFNTQVRNIYDQIIML